MLRGDSQTSHTGRSGWLRSVHTEHDHDGVSFVVGAGTDEGVEGEGDCSSVTGFLTGEDAMFRDLLPSVFEVDLKVSFIGV